MTNEIGRALVFSKPEHDNATNAEAFGVSIIFHIAIVLAAMWLTIAPPRREEAEQQHILIPVLQEEKAQELPPPPPPPPASREIQQAVEQAPRGFQTLTVPTYISPEIPPPMVGAEIDEADFSGEGVEGGRGRGVAPDPERVVTTEDVSAAPAFTPYTLAPVLRNREEIARVLQDNYPALLRDAGIGGRVMMWLFIDERGQVRKTQVKESSQIAQLDSAAVRVSRKMRFSPAQNREVKVPVWVALPVSFEVRQF